jgi:hypothetical protein
MSQLDESSGDISESDERVTVAGKLLWEKIGEGWLFQNAEYFACTSIHCYTCSLECSQSDVALDISHSLSQLRLHRSRYFPSPVIMLFSRTLGG